MTFGLVSRIGKPIRGPEWSSAVSRSAISPAVFSVPFLAGQKGDTTAKAHCQYF
jgi:hypothetical protein